MEKIDPQQKEALDLFEKGRRLHQMASSPGYKDLLSIFEDIADTYEARLINIPSGESDTLIRDLLAEAKVARSILQLVERQVQQLISMGESAVLDSLQDKPTYSNF